MMRGLERGHVSRDLLFGFLFAWVQQERPTMCDFSLHSVRSRPAAVGDKLMTHSFGTGTRGFAAFDDPGLAVCLMPGTELAFADNISILPYGIIGSDSKTVGYRTAIFRQVNKEKLAVHHDAVEFPDG